MNKTAMMMKALEEVAASNYLDKTEDGFSFEIYADYDALISDKTVSELLEAADPVVALMEKMFEWYSECEFETKDKIIQDVLSELKTQEDFVQTDDTEEEVSDFVMTHVYPDYPLDHFLQQEICVNIMMDTGDGNFDYVLNKCFPAYMEDKNKMIDKRASLVWLAKTQGYTRGTLWNALLEGDMTCAENFLESCRVEVANVASHMNVVVFLVKIPLNELVKLNMLIKAQDRNGVLSDNRENPDCGIIKIKKETTCGLYDPWNGGGSVLDIQLEKDIDVPIKLIRSALPDGCDGHSIRSVYGMCESVWRKTVNGLFYSKKVKEVLCG